MRVTQATVFRTSLTQIRRAQEALATAQEQVSTGRRINRPSDDPVGVRAAAVIKDSIVATERFQQNISRSRARTRAVEEAVGGARDLLVDAMVLALTGANSATERQLLIPQVEAIYNQVLSAANSRVGGAYVFAGFDADSAPFSFVGFTDGVPAPPMIFSGSTAEVEISVDEGVRLPVTLNGQRVFLGDSDGDGAPDAGKLDVFELLGRLRDGLRAGNIVTIRNTLPDFEAALQQMSGEITRIGSVDAEINLWEDRQSLRDGELRSQLSSVEDVVDTKAITDLLRQEGALTATLAATARLIRPSLLDFI